MGASIRELNECGLRLLSEVVALRSDRNYETLVTTT